MSITHFLRCSDDELLSDYGSPEPEGQQEQGEDLPPGVAAEEEDIGDLPSAEASDGPSDASRWPVRSAVLTETCLEGLLELTLVRCRCGRTCASTVDRVSMTFVVNWVRRHC